MKTFMKKILRQVLFFVGVGLAFLPLREALAEDVTSPVWPQHFEIQLKVLKENLTDNPEVIQDIIRANQMNAPLTQKEIFEIDQHWQQIEGVDLFVVSLITNNLADKLKALQKKQRNLVEIFITDNRGLLIAATNKTSDFYQADEDWWQQAFQLKKADGFLGPVEYDKSALTEAVPLYLVILDEKKSVIGILKALCSMNKTVMGEAS